jgi:hypothetical protein
LPKVELEWSTKFLLQFSAGHILLRIFLPLTTPIKNPVSQIVDKKPKPVLRLEGTEAAASRQAARAKNPIMTVIDMIAFLLVILCCIAMAQIDPVSVFKTETNQTCDGRE